MAAKKERVVVKQDENEPVAKEVLAKAILTMSKAAGALLACGLSQDDLALLVARRSPGVGIGTVKVVLRGLDSLRKDYAA